MGHVEKRASRALLRPAGALLLLVVACAESESIAEHETAVAVRRYNQALPLAYARANPAPLAEAATPAEMQRVTDTIGFLAQGGMIMDSRQESFEPGAVAFPDDANATLEATEVWWYQHKVPDTGEVRQAPRRVKYRNRYHLTRADGRWVVDRLEELGFEDIGLDEKAGAQ